MSVREEDRRKNSCSSRGLGLAAAAIGVGVGAALYYFFSKRPENPDTEGSTSEGWSCEQPQNLNISTSPKSEYTTISEHTTTDTSIWITDNNESASSCQRKQRKKDNNHRVKKQKKKDSSTDTSYTSSSTMDSSYEDYDTSCCGCCNDSTSSDLEEEYTITDTGTSNEESSEDEANDSMEVYDSESVADTENESSLETGYITLRTTSSHSHNRTQETASDSEMESDWDVTSSSTDIPTDTNSATSPFLRHLFNRLNSSRLQNNSFAEDERTRTLREQAFRERRWSLEECAICFEVMLKDQPLMQLPCTHNFHVACIGPWLQEQQTCPMCRKAAE